MTKFKAIISLLLIMPAAALFAAPKVAEHLQDISVTIKAEDRFSRSEGSGVLIIRKIDGEDVTFVWTAAHVVDNLRTVREAIDSKGNSRKVVEFKDAKVVKELVERGRRVGEIKMDARVIKYSDYDDGHDLALLMVRAKDYGKAGAKFLIAKKDDVVPIGTELYHVGSLLGQMGSNSMTSGIIAQVGRTQGKMEFDQTTVTAFPGSSGGGVYLKSGEYVGMLVRGAGEGFNLIVPIRRMYKWASENDLLWSLDATVEAPGMEEILKMPIETSTSEGTGSGGDSKGAKFPFLIRKTTIGE